MKKKEQREREREQEHEKGQELDVDPETVKDLELDEGAADQVQGGGGTHHNCPDTTFPVLSI